MAREGEFAKVKAYQIDAEISYEGVGGPVNAGDNAATATLKTKSKNRLEPAKVGNKEQERPKTAVVKPSIRKEMARANQKTVKLTKEQEKLKKMQDRLSDLTKKYRVHFGEDLKVKKEGNQTKQRVKIAQNPQK